MLWLSSDRRLHHIYHDPYAGLNCARAGGGGAGGGQVQLWQFLLDELASGAPGICWEVHGKRYAYRFSWTGLAAACQAQAPDAPWPYLAPRLDPAAPGPPAPLGPSAPPGPHGGHAPHEPQAPQGHAAHPLPHNQ
ncbi:hypothetical protein MSG28_006033 [Choristoneura fumiferana]|uniref:Uncharacterized protein n=1 Tax=Choristoneura fumiferana TaxID=7141 RepID=A0ACC0JDC1_CHOFU|nr:hypothetical protein MSG28_006033 [Choristoneura fumiferana]